MNRGRIIYKSTSLKLVKIISSIIIITLFANLYFKTVAGNPLGNSELSGFSSVMEYYLMYPHDLILYFVFILLPCIYYAYIRGVVFFENGVLINRGLPFFNNFISYDLIDSFDVIHDDFFIAIKRKDTEDEVLFTISNMDRALAVLDQNGIKGDLSKRGGDQQRGRRIGGFQKLLFFFALAGGASFLLEKIDFLGLF